MTYLFEINARIFERESEKNDLFEDEREETEEDEEICKKGSFKTCIVHQTVLRVII
jgi:hypothetical protein